MNDEVEELIQAEEQEALERTIPLELLEAPIIGDKEKSRRTLNRDPSSFRKDGSLHHAHALYLNYTTIDSVSSLTGVDRDIVRYFVYKPNGWKQEREKLETELAEEVKKTSIEQLRTINVACLDIVEKAITEFKVAKERDNEEITLHEAKMVTNIWQKIHGGKLLEEATIGGDSILSKTPQDVLRAFKNDPFLSEALQAIDVTPQKDDEEVEKEDLPVVEDEDPTFAKEESVRGS